MLTDTHGRSVNYMRISVTDRCNLNCFYCRSPQCRFISHDRILRYEEIISLMRLAQEMGVGKVRLTGGEPLVRRDFLSFLERAVAAAPGLDIRLTTNATLLADKVQPLADLGLKYVNISLDSLIPRVYREITGRDAFAAVRHAIDRCLEVGLRVKINAVAMRGVNDAELPGFLALARELPLDVRFIEVMPLGDDRARQERLYWPADDVLAAARSLADLTPDAGGASATDGPARMYRVEGGLGRLGVISPMSHHFCQACNRLRITSDGRLRTCLFSDREYRLRPLLRHPKLGIEAARRVIELAGAKKPLGAELLQALRTAEAGRRMSGIGG